MGRESYAKKKLNILILNLGSQTFVIIVLFYKLCNWHRHHHYSKVDDEVISHEMKSDTCFIKINTFFVFLKVGYPSYKSMLA